jgi:dGTPase
VISEFAPYAVTAAVSRGRRIAETAPTFRSEFQRDRDRIVHSTAFRRLEYKTQVFVNHEGDLFRTRLTHSIEVAQIARSIARALQLNDDLAEAIALAHDLGHTPFGHAGQDALNECMLPYGGFEHNLQSLRIVDALEQHYGAFDGLNLMFETREGILKHCSLAHARSLGELGERFLQGHQPSLEAQICNLADEIAYNNHDVDDGLRSSLISLDQLKEIPLFGRHLAETEEAFPGIIGRRRIHETIRRIINAQVTDLLATTQQAIAALAPKSLDDIHLSPPLVGFSPLMTDENRTLKKFLREQLYRHYQVVRMTTKAQRVIRDLFTAFVSEPRLLPPQYQASAAADGLPRATADYVAGMTDRYAIKEHQRLFLIGNASL